VGAAVATLNSRRAPKKLKGAGSSTFTIKNVSGKPAEVVEIKEAKTGGGFSITPKELMNCLEEYKINEECSWTAKYDGTTSGSLTFTAVDETKILPRTP
jgi:hypothetical protein